MLAQQEPTETLPTTDVIHVQPNVPLVPVLPSINVTAVQDHLL